MNRLPVGVDLSFFHGQRLIQLCIGKHELQLNFDEGVTISVESVIGLAKAQHAETRCEDLTQAVPLLTGLLNLAIASATGTSEGTLQLEFEDGRRLSIYDSGRQYESYTIKHRGQIIVV